MFTCLMATGAPGKIACVPSEPRCSQPVQPAHLVLIVRVAGQVTAVGPKRSDPGKEGKGFKHAEAGFVLFQGTHIWDARMAEKTRKSLRSVEAWC